MTKHVKKIICFLIVVTMGVGFSWYGCMGASVYPLFQPASPLPRGADYDKTIACIFLKAASEGDMEWLQAYVERYEKSIIDVPDEEGVTPVMYALMSGQLEAALFLLAKGANVALCAKDGRTALMWAAAYSEMSEFIDVLLRAPLGAAMLNISADKAEGMTALMFAANYGNLAAVKKLLDYKANKDKVSATGKKAIDYARAADIDIKTKEEIIKLLS